MTDFTISIQHAHLPAAPFVTLLYGHYSGLASFVIQSVLTQFYLFAMWSHWYIVAKWNKLCI